jgi:hypothetical protein
MPWCSNEVRCSGIECRGAATKSAAAAWNAVLQSPMAALLPSFVPKCLCMLHRAKVNRTSYHGSEAVVAALQRGLRTSAADAAEQGSGIPCRRNEVPQRPCSVAAPQGFVLQLSWDFAQRHSMPLQRTRDDGSYAAITMDRRNEVPSMPLSAVSSHGMECRGVLLHQFCNPAVMLLRRLCTQLSTIIISSFFF